LNDLIYPHGWTPRTASSGRGATPALAERPEVGLEVQEGREPRRHRADVIKTIRELVREVVGDATAWREGSFAIFQAFTEESWCVQIAGAAGATFVVEVSGPRDSNGKPFIADQIGQITHLGFIETEVNYQCFTTLKSPAATDQLSGRLEFVLTNALWLRTASDVKSTLELGNARRPRGRQPLKATPR